jgi:hypothetical protein
LSRYMKRRYVSQIRNEREIEKHYMTESRRNLYVACLNFDFVWDEDDVEKAKELWKSGLHIGDMAKELNRDVDELALLLFDLAARGKIRPRRGGAVGWVTTHGDTTPSGESSAS